VNGSPGCGNTTITPVPTNTPVPTLTPTPTPTPTPTQTPIPQAEVLLNGSTFSAFSRLVATLRVNQTINRSFTVYSVIILPNGAMINTLNLGSRIVPLALNVRGLSAPFSVQLLSAIVPPGQPKGGYTVLVAFFDPLMPIFGVGSAFLTASNTFTIQ